MELRHTVIDTDLGELILVGRGEALAGIYFEGHWTMPPAETLGPKVEIEGDSVFPEVESQLSEFLKGERTEFDVPVTLKGDPFQEKVWHLEEIPFGETVTYGYLAGQLGDKALARRVGGAVGANPVSIIVPCHRVVGSNGNLTGYAGGLERKQILLELEAPEASEAGRLF